MKQTLRRTGKLRVHTARDGYHVIADITAPPFHGAFTVRLAARLKARIGLGTVEAIIPTLQGRRIDGKDAEGEQGRVPLLDLSDGPGDNLRSWVCLRVVADLNTGVIDPDNPESATIVHLQTLIGVFNGAALDDGVGAAHLPLAMLVWADDRTVQRIVQNVYFNQRHSFTPPERGLQPAPQAARGLHLFLPAA